MDKLIGYYLVAKEGKYKQDENGNYIDCVIALPFMIEKPKTKEEERAKVLEMKEWFAKQINVFPFWVSVISKEEYDKFD